MGAAPKLDEAWPIIDAQKLQAIKNLGEPDDEDDFFKELLNIFFQRCPALLAELDAAVAAKDPVKVERSGHALKGTSGNLGAMMMMKLAEQLEVMGRSGKVENASEVLAELHKTYPLTKKELETKWL
jgi:HPt (histidine-containing phosphotransfer) domain-containing protein